MLSLPTTHAVTLEASPIASSSMKRLPISPEGRDYRYAKSSRTPVPLRPLATTSAQSDSSHQECPSSPLTPLWTGAFPTGSTSRSPASSMSIESCVVTPQMEYFAWGAQAHKDKEVSGDVSFSDNSLFHARPAQCSRRRKTLRRPSLPEHCTR